MVTPRTVLVTGVTGYIGGRLVPRLVPEPVLTPRLSSYWLHRVTPVPAVMARPLIQGLRHDVIVRAEMKVPGRAWPEFRVEPVDAGTSRLSQTAFFAPRGLSGLLYWYLLYPIHAVIFSGMARTLARRAEASDHER